MLGPKGSAVIGQSGGPTAVINESLVGAVIEARKHPNIDRVLGALHGVKGVLAEQFLDFADESREHLDQVARTPSAALGSVRKKPSADECKAMFEIFKKNGVRYFFYIGGNDSAETAHIVSQCAQADSYDLRVVHIPKTIDNDLVGHHHCPGYGSAARFVAMAFMGDNLDNASLPGIKVNVVMGRHAGFLTAASALARVHDEDGPHLIYLPERDFVMDKFIEDVKRVYDRLGRCLIAVSEGLHDDAGNLLAEKFTHEVDSHGNKQLSGTGALGDYLSNEIKARLGSKLRVRADTFGYMQRSFVGVRSETDAAEARLVGEMGVLHAALRNENGSIALTPNPGHPQEMTTHIIPLESVAQKTKRMPNEWINSKGNDVTEGFISYGRPLAGKLPHVARLNRTYTM